jgi:hypothetical protein
MNTQSPSLKKYTNDRAWLHELVSSDAVSAGKASLKYLVRVYYKETGDAPTTTTKNLRAGSFALLDLKHCLASQYVCALIMCHRDSSRVHPEILDLL